MAVIEALSWPLTVVACFITGCLLFRAQVASFLSRATSVGKDGIKTSAPAGQTAQFADKMKQAQDLVEALASPVLREQESIIRKELEDKGVYEDSESVRVLIKYLANAQLVIRYEQTYRLLFGSQIHLLKRANEQRGAGIEKDAVSTYFDNVKAGYAPNFDQWTVDAYVQFLLDSHLLVEDQKVYAITNFGVDFLQWMMKVGASENKRL